MADRRGLSTSYESLGIVSQALGRLKEAQRYYEQMLTLSEHLVEETGTAEGYDDLALSYCKLSIMGNRKREYLEKACKIWEQLAEQCPSVPDFAEWKDIVKRFLD